MIFSERKDHLVYVSFEVRRQNHGAEIYRLQYHTGSDISSNEQMMRFENKNRHRSND